MSALIDNFTQNLKPCSGCGSSSIWSSIPEKDDIMQYAVTVIIEADTLKSAILKVPDDLGEVASAVPRPQPVASSATRITGNAFQQSTTAAVPKLNG